MKKIIIFDGIDNSGKTTAVQDIYNNNKDKVQMLKFPSQELLDTDQFKSFISNPISEHNLEDLVVLIFSEMLYKLQKVSEKVDTIVIDRFIYSTFVYQGFYFDIYNNGTYRIDDKYVGMIKSLFYKTKLQAYLLSLKFDKGVKFKTIFFTQPISKPHSIKNVTTEISSAFDSKTFYYTQIWNTYIQSHLHSYLQILAPFMIFKNREDENFKNIILKLLK